MINRETESNYQYNGLISLLDQNIYVNYPSYKLVENMISSKGLISDTDEDMNVIYIPEKSQIDDGTELSFKKEKLTKSSDGKSVLLNGDGSRNKGIVVADCDVIVSTNFYGTIITTGNVILKGGVTVTAEYTVGFDNIAQPEQSTDTSERVKITYRNWKKNK